MLYYFLSLFIYVVTVSYCCILVTPTMYCSVISVSVIHSYKNLLRLWYLTLR